MTRNEALKELGDSLIQIRELYRKTIKARSVLSNLDNEALTWSLIKDDLIEHIEMEYEYLLNRDELKWLLDYYNGKIKE